MPAAALANCCKLSTLICLLQEVLMSFAAKPSREATQLPLFRWHRQQPSWEAMPIEIRQQVERLLARMLRDHAARKLGVASPREDRDE
jgi:hypothetical protein